MRYPNEGGFTEDENLRIEAFDRANGVTYTDRPTLAEDADALIAMFQKSGCAFWRRGMGTLSNRPGFKPGLVLAEREGR